MFLNKKENNFLLLEQQLQQEKSNQQEKTQLAKLQQEFEHIQIRNRASLAEKEA